MSTILDNSVQLPQNIDSVTAVSMSKANANTTTKNGHSRTKQPFKSTDSSDTDSLRPPSLTFSSSASSSDTMTESENTHSPEDECSELWPSKVFCSNQQTPLVVLAESDSYIDVPITPKPILARKLSFLSLKHSDLKAEDDAGYESGKEGRRIAIGMGRPRLSRAESFKRKGSAQVMQQYRQTNLMRASPLHSAPTSAPTTPTGKSGGTLARPARPTQIELPSEVIISATDTAAILEDIGLGINVPPSSDGSAQLQVRRNFSPNSLFEDNVVSPASTPESLISPPPLKVRLGPTILDRHPSVTDDLPPLLIGTPGYINSSPLPKFLKGSHAPMSMSALLTIASQANTQKAGDRATKQYVDEVNKQIGIGRPAMKETQRAATSPLQPGSSTVREDQDSESSTPKEKRSKIPRVHSLALMQKHNTLPRRPSYQEDILHNRPTHAYLIPSPSTVPPKKHVSTPFPSPKSEEAMKLNDEVIVIKDKEDSNSSQKSEDLEIKKRCQWNPYFNL